MSHACVANALYTDMVLSGFNMPEYSKFFADMVNKNLINGCDATVGDKQEILDFYTKEEDPKATIYRFTKDAGGYSSLKEFMNNGSFDHAVVRIKTGPDSGHNINIYKNFCGGYSISDHGHIHRHGMPWGSIITPHNFIYFELIRRD